MERAASEIETELVDLSTSTLQDLDHGPMFRSAIQRLLDAVESPLTSVNSASGESCLYDPQAARTRHPGAAGAGGR
ncbi:hypothetical protein ACZ90_19165 [Streptomyces albus subsp. albus]|nr:hypothetical protein ACZ90_19165 [Streptomyces albus subsp. albus]